MPPPEFEAETNAGALRVKPLDNLGDFELYDQLIILDEKGVGHPLELNPQMSLKALRDKVNSLGIKSIKSARINCDEQFEDTYKNMLDQLWPNGKKEELPRFEIGILRVPIKTTFRFTDHYFRAIAKIAFHYYLVHSQRSKGNEECFAPIRNFIMNGGKEYGVIAMHTIEPPLKKEKSER